MRLPRHIPELDGVRALVVLSIALFHITLAVGWRPNHELPAALQSSWFFSVEFLFVLAGLVAFTPVVRSGKLGSVRAYALRRAGRILPLYYLSLLVALVLAPLLRDTTGVSSPAGLEAVLAHLLFIQRQAYPLQEGFGVQGIVWAMSILALFYVLFPAVARRYLQHPLAGLALAALITAGWHVLAADDPNLLLQFPVFAADFAAGMTAAWALARLWERRSRPLAALLAAAGALALLGLCLYLSGLPVARGEQGYWGEGPLLGVAVPLLFAALLVALPLCPAAVRAPLASRPLRFLSGISYGFFLFHFLVIWAALALFDIPRAGAPASVLELSAIVLPVTTLVAWLGTRYVERPLREWSRRLAERSAEAVPARTAPAPAPGSIRELWIPAFDGVRGLVAVSIALAHVARAVGWYPQNEALRAFRFSWFFSVEFLFLLGAFVAFLPLLVFGRFSVTSFAVRRVGRIGPLYVLTIVLAFALVPLLQPVSGQVDAPDDVAALAVHLAFLQNFFYPFQAGFGVQGIVWTMTIAVSFWVLYPLIARTYARHPLAGLAIAVTLVAVWRLGWQLEPNVSFQFPRFAADFALGMTAAWCYVRLTPVLREHPRPRLALAVGGGAAALGLLLLYESGLGVVQGRWPLWGEGLTLAFGVPALFAVVLVSLPFMPAAVQSVFSNRFMRFLGDVSFGVFLFHFLVIWGALGLFDLPRDGSLNAFLLLTAIVLPVTVLCGWLGTKYVERPIRERAWALAERRRSSELQAAARSSERLRAAGGGAAPANSGGAIAR